MCSCVSQLKHSRLARMSYHDSFGVRLASCIIMRHPVQFKVGVWYELAFHDITQCNGCGCTQFNMTRHGNVIEDMPVPQPASAVSVLGGQWLGQWLEVYGHMPMAMDEGG